jgi:uncharacterized NAD(P)/FAD-binding protein YdhS
VPGIKWSSAMSSTAQHAEIIALQPHCSHDPQFRSHALQNPSRDVTIVGGGASAVLLACHLLRDPGRGLRVTLIEKRQEVGRGIAYGTANPEHLLNVRAANMSAFPDQPDHFWRWLCARRKGRTDAEALDCSDPFCFVPRRVYGDYIANLISPLLSTHERAPGLHVIRGECIEVAEGRSGVVVTLADGSHHTARMAVLAVGHESPVIGDSCYADPWTTPSTAGIAEDSKILILGTGLTMIDYVLTLALAGHRGPIIAMSRRGLLPRSHRSIEPLHIDADDVPFGSDISALLRWLRRLIKAHAERGGDWRSVIDGIRPYNQRIWQALSPGARRRFLEHMRAWWDVHRHRMAPEVETRINAMIGAARLTIVAGKVCAVQPDASGALVLFRRRRKNATESMHVKMIVECRGTSLTPWETGNPVLRSLLGQGLGRADALRIGLDVTPECAIINQDGIPSTRLFAVGPLTRAAFWEITAVPDIRTQCAELAARIIGGLRIHS